MSIETALAGRIGFEKVARNKEQTMVTEKTHPFEYPECGGHPASSPYNWVLTDYLGYRFAKLLHVTDEDIKQKSKS